MAESRSGHSSQVATRSAEITTTRLIDERIAQARVLVNSGFLPKTINTPEKAIAIIQTGQELGLPPMLSLRSIHIIEGRPQLSADLMAALVQRAIDEHGDGLFAVDDEASDETRATVVYRRWGWENPKRFTYTIEMAKRAGLAGRSTWQQHPEAMLRARAISAAARLMAPDIVAGLYAPEEFEAGTSHEPPAPITARIVRPTAGVIDLTTGEILDDEVVAFDPSGVDLVRPTGDPATQDDIRALHGVASSVGLHHDDLRLFADALFAKRTRAGTEEDGLTVGQVGILERMILAFGSEEQGREVWRATKDAIAITDPELWPTVILHLEALAACRHPDDVTQLAQSIAATPDGDALVAAIKAAGAARRRVLNGSA